MLHAPACPSNHLFVFTTPDSPYSIHDPPLKARIVSVRAIRSARHLGISSITRITRSANLSTSSPNSHPAMRWDRSRSSVVAFTVCATASACSATKRITRGLRRSKSISMPNCLCAHAIPVSTASSIPSVIPRASAWSSSARTMSTVIARAQRSRSSSVGGWIRTCLARSICGPSARFTPPSIFCSAPFSASRSSSPTPRG